jgi:hypothetical protein
MTAKFCLTAAATLLAGSAASAVRVSARSPNALRAPRQPFPRLHGRPDLG